MAAKNGKARLVGVLGDPIVHSLSPAIHEYWLNYYDVNGAYVPLGVKANQFVDLVNQCVQAGFVGFNVTLPHKRAAYEMVTSRDDPSERCGAVNTIVTHHNGAEYHGMNTDVFGFMCLIEDARKHHDVTLDRVVVLGAGGAARAVVSALHSLGAQHVTVTNRTHERAVAMQEHFLPYMPSNSRLDVVPSVEVLNAIEQADCIVNTVSVGVSAYGDVLALMRASSAECMMIDISYGMNGTDFTRAADKAGRFFSDGLPMLMWQAVPGFEQWFGIRPAVTKALMQRVIQCASA